MTNSSGTNFNNGVAVGPQGEGRDSSSRFPTYPTYKDSGVEWLGDVPESWTVTLLKRGYEVVLGKMLQPEAKRDDDEFLPYLRAANIQVSGVDISDVKKMWFGFDEKKSLLLRRGDLLVSEGGDVGRSAIWDLDEECYFQNSINRIRSISGNDTRFLYFWMITIKGNGYVDVLCNKSTIAHFTAEKVAAVPLPIPSINEQIQIARFLDHETARIDALIEEQQRLIELLKEKRHAVISHAVTKGLDPAVPMKDSGVEWLGEVPAHWQIAPLKYSARVVGRIGFRGYTTEDIVDEGDGALTLSPSNMVGGSMNFDKSTYISWGKYHESPEIQLRQGDVILVKTGSTYGRVAFVDHLPCETTINPQLAVFKDIKFESKLLFYLFESAYLKSLTKNSNTGGTMPTMTQENIGNYKIPMPGRAEMGLILGFIEAQVKLIEDLVGISENSVSLLNERRFALISAAVTGKIDVRGWQPPADAATASVP